MLFRLISVTTTVFPWNSKRNWSINSTCTTTTIVLRQCMDCERLFYQTSKPSTSARSCVIDSSWYVYHFQSDPSRNLIISGGLAALWWITPRQGSIAGGTRVYLHGSGFSTDQYTTADLVFFGGIQCDVDWFTVRSWRIECITRPHPTAKRGDTILQPTTIVSGSVVYSSSST